MRAIYKIVSGQKIMVGTCADTGVADDDHAYTSNFTFAQLPDVTPEIRQYIDAHSMVNLSLYKVDETANEVQLRSPTEMDAVPHVAWEYRVKAGA